MLGCHALAFVAAMAAVALPATARGDDGDGHLGVVAEVGLPSGMALSFAYRPHPNLTAHAGIGHNLNGPGLLAGARWSPWLLKAQPYLAIEGGHYFRSDSPQWIVDTAKSAGLDDKTLQRLGYSFASSHIGVQLGSGQPAFFIQAGLSFVRAGTNYIKPKPKLTPPVDLYRETIINLWIIGGQMGVLWYF